MRGLEISERFYREFGSPMLERDFSDVLGRIAVGVVGEGSDCLGYDDGLSRDHDFDPGFCLFITEEDGRSFGFRLERAYAKLPKEFMGISRPTLSPAGGNRRGVITVEEFYTRHLGAPTAPDTLRRWLEIPSPSLLAASNGRIFADPLGVFSSVRDTLRRGYPEDIRLKKLAAHSALMGQAGQYNYSRLIERGETGAAQLAVFEFVRHAISAVYLLNNRYEPFYKWAYRGMRELSVLQSLEELLICLTELDNTPKVAAQKAEIIEDIAVMFIDEYKNQGISSALCTDLDTHARSITDHIKDNDLRNMHIMDGI